MISKEKSFQLIIVNKKIKMKLMIKCIHNLWHTKGKHEKINKDILKCAF